MDTGSARRDGDVGAIIHERVVREVIAAEPVIADKPVNWVGVLVALAVWLSWTVH